MAWYFVILIIIGFYLLMGPIMLGFAKLNKVDPYILQRDNLDELLKTKEGERSYIIVKVFYYLFTPLFFEKWLIDKIRKKSVH